MELMLSSELHWWSLPEDEQNFWLIFVPSDLFNILFSLVMLQFLRQCWHREDETEQKQTQLQMILRGGGGNFIWQLTATMALMQEAQDEHCARFQNEMESVKKVMVVNKASHQSKPRLQSLLTCNNVDSSLQLQAMGWMARV
jgi:hypothetical protein